MHRRRRQPGTRPPLLAGLLVALVVATACGPGAASTPPSQAAVATPSPTATPSPSPTATPSPTPTPTPTADPGAVDPARRPDRPAASPGRRPSAAAGGDDRRLAPARPQSGFNAASVVYQAPADGYESRYLLIFQEFETDDIGPVRSARFFLVQWAQEIAFGVRPLRRRPADAHVPAPAQEAVHRRRRPGSRAAGLPPDQDAARRRTTRTPRPRTCVARPTSSGRPSRCPTEALPASVRRPLARRRARRAPAIRVPYQTNVITYATTARPTSTCRSVDGKAHIDPADGKRVDPTNVVVLFQQLPHRHQDRARPFAAGHQDASARARPSSSGRAASSRRPGARPSDADPTLLARRRRQGASRSCAAGRSSRSSRQRPR